jgi:hypothetical protein
MLFASDCPFDKEKGRGAQHATFTTKKGKSEGHDVQGRETSQPDQMGDSSCWNNSDLTLSTIAIVVPRRPDV